MKRHKPQQASRQWKHHSLLLPLIALLALGMLSACGTTTAPPSANPTPTPTPTPFHALFALSATLDALDPASGARIWTQALPGYTTRAPAVAGEVVAISLGLPTTQPPTGRVAAYAAKSGAPLWQQDLGANTQGAIFAAGSAFVLATNAVSLEAPNAPTGLTIATLHPGDGSVIWRHTLTDTDLPAPILYSQGTLFIVSAQVTATDMNYSLTAFDVTSGSQLWQKALGMGTLTGYVVGDAAVYVSMFAGHVPAEGSPHAVVASAAALDIAVSNPALRSPNDGTLTAYRASDGMQPWQASGFMTAQAEIGGMLYATVGQQQSSGLAAFAVRAYRATSGEQLWQSDTLGSGDIYQDKPAVCVDTRAAYVFNKPETQPGVHALNGASGRPVWSVPLADHVVSSVAGLDRVYAGAVTTPPAVVQTQVTVIALDAASGATEWKGLARQDPERPACAAVVPPSEPASHPPAWCGSAVSSPFSW